MQNAAFAALGLDWTYLAEEVEPEALEEVVFGLAGRGFAGANVTAPYKLDVARLIGAKEPSVNTLVVQPGGIKGFTTDAAVLHGLPCDRPAIVGDGGTAVAFRQALPGAHVFSRRGEWPPDVSGADLVVHATPIVAHPVVLLKEGQTLVDLPYPGSATARAARQARATVLDGLEVLVAQGAASFTLWTGLPAPVEIMRRAVGLSDASPRHSG